MLKFRVSLDGRDGWTWSSGRWRSGTQWIEPFLNPALECALFVEGGSTLVVVRERTRGLASQFASDSRSPLYGADLAAVSAAMREWPLEFVTLELSPGRITLRSGLWGTAPVYLVASKHDVEGSWDLADLRRHIRSSDLDDREVARFLVRRHRYTSRTVSRRVSRLTAGATVVVAKDEQPAWLHPAPSPQYRPRELRPGARVVEAYESLLCRAVGQWSTDGLERVVELSGGMDSATVAWALATNRADRIVTYGILIGGQARSQQTARRNALVAAFDASDTTVDGQRWLPFDPRGQRMAASAFSPWDEPYSEALEAALTATDRSVVFTGIGGDELLARRGTERTETSDKRPDGPSFLGARAADAVDAIDDDLPPTTAIPETALTAMLSRSPVFLRAGRWPISPLCSPALVRFGEWLPLSWRDNKRLPRELLARAGLPGDVVRPTLRENFVSVMQAGLRQHGLPLLRRFLHGSVLVDLGYVNGAALRRAYDVATRADTIDTSLYEVLALELGLRTLV